jgi:hypothetical protein
VLAIVVWNAIGLIGMAKRRYGSDSFPRRGHRDEFGLLTACFCRLYYGVLETVADRSVAAPGRSECLAAGFDLSWLSRGRSSCVRVNERFFKYQSQIAAAWP